MKLKTKYTLIYNDPKKNQKETVEVVVKLKKHDKVNLVRGSVYYGVCEINEQHIEKYDELLKHAINTDYWAKHIGEEKKNELIKKYGKRKKKNIVEKIS